MEYPVHLVPIPLLLHPNLPWMFLTLRNGLLNLVLGLSGSLIWPSPTVQSLVRVILKWALLQGHLGIPVPLAQPLEKLLKVALVPEVTEPYRQLVHWELWNKELGLYHPLVLVIPTVPVRLLTQSATRCGYPYKRYQFVLTIRVVQSVLLFVLVTVGFIDHVNP